jgi:hypothetical protein
MKWPTRTVGELAARASIIASEKRRRRVTQHTILLALDLKLRSYLGARLDESAEALGFSRTYVAMICGWFGIEYPDFKPRNPEPYSLD